jgi:hypothetical protein
MLKRVPKHRLLIAQTRDTIVVARVTDAISSPSICKSTIIDLLEILSLSEIMSVKQSSHRIISADTRFSVIQLCRRVSTKFSHGRLGLSVERFSA